MSSGFVLPPGAQTSVTARHLRTEGGAAMLVDQVGDGLLMWVCNGCHADHTVGYPMDRPFRWRYATSGEAWTAALDSALTHAKTCRVPSAIVPDSGLADGLRLALDAETARARQQAELLVLIRNAAEYLAALRLSRRDRKRVARFISLAASGAWSTGEARAAWKAVQG
jgi:hypothetical protein